MGRLSAFLNTVLRQLYVQKLGFPAFGNSKTSSVNPMLRRVISSFLITLLGSLLMFYHFPRGNWLFLCWGIIELSFFLLNAIRIHSLNRQVPAYSPTDEEVVQNFDKFLNSLHLVKNHTDHLKGWFFEEEFASIYRRNCIEFLAYAFGHQTRERMKSSNSEALFEDLLKKLEKQEQVSFKQGYDPNRQFKSHLWDDLRVFHFPCIVYILIEAISLVFALWMVLLGFQCKSLNGRRFYTKTATKGQKKDPIVFLHGLGVGPIIYLSFIKALCTLDHPIVLLDMPQISTRFCWGNPSIDQTVHDLKEILNQLGISGCHVMGHSYGTLIASRFWKLYPTCVASLSLIDPVCCAMHNPKLLTNFVYGEVSFKSHNKFLNSVFSWVCSHDPSICASVCRGFHWTLLNLWPDEIHDETLLVLSEGDSLVPVKDVKSIFSHSSARLLCHPSHPHAGFLMDYPWQQSILSSIKDTLNSTNRSFWTVC